MEDEINAGFMLFTPWTFLFLFLIVIVGNLFLIDVALFWQKPSKSTPIKATGLKVLPSPSPTTTSCDAACKEEIQKAVSLAIPNTAVAKQSLSTAKEYFITVGTGSSNAENWTDVPGVAVYIDSTAYGKIKSTTFEASLYTPTNNQSANARLFNVTDGHPVWNSEVSIEGGTPQLKISTPITLSFSIKSCLVNEFVKTFKLGRDKAGTKKAEAVECLLASLIVN